jgi:hypothetical protein
MKNVTEQIKEFSVEAFMEMEGMSREDLAKLVGGELKEIQDELKKIEGVGEIVDEQLRYKQRHKSRKLSTVKACTNI